MLHSPLPPAAAAAVGLALSPVPGPRRAYAGKRMRKPAAPDAELLELGRQWKASCARQQAITAEVDASADTLAPAFEALLEEMTKQAEIGAELRYRMARLRATTWPGILLKIELASWAYDVEDEDFFAEVLAEGDKHLVGTMSLLRDLRAWFAQPQPDAQLLQLGEQLERAWQQEAAAWAAYQSAPRGDRKRDALGEQWDAASNATKRVAEQIEKLPATTLAGLAVKARACSWTHEGEAFDGDFFEGDCSLDHRLAAAVLGDLLKIDGRPLPAQRRAA